MQNDRHRISYIPFDYFTFIDWIVLSNIYFMGLLEDWEMKKIIRYCDDCGKETKEYLKILFFSSPARVCKSISFDLCLGCAKKKLKELI